VVDFFLRTNWSISGVDRPDICRRLDQPEANRRVASSRRPVRQSFVHSGGRPPDLTVCLLPGQPLRALAGELLALGFVLWLTITFTQRATVRGNSYVTSRQRILYRILTQISLMPYLLAGILLRSAGGLYWVVAAISLSYLAALMDAWVLLIEIQR
jgi:hypothetical protein